MAADEAPTTAIEEAPPTATEEAPPMATEEAPKIKVYWLENSRAQRILWLLEELNLEYELEIFHRDKAGLAPPELEKVHPLGKSPVITVTPPGSSEPVVLAESGLIIQYLCEHFGQGTNLIPKRWKDGQEGKVGGDTEEWLRYQYYMYYSEGSIMPVLLVALILNKLKSKAVPFFIRPISASIANTVSASYVTPNIKKHLAFLESQLGSAPNGGGYLCGDKLTAADIIMSYPLFAARDRFDTMGKWEGGSAKAAHPKLFAYAERLEAEAGYKKSADKILEIEGKFQANL